MKSSLRHYFLGWKKKHLSNETKIKSKKNKNCKVFAVRKKKCIPSLLIHFVLVLFWGGIGLVPPSRNFLPKATHKSRAVSSKDRTMIIRSKRFLSRTEGEPLEQRHQVDSKSRTVLVPLLLSVFSCGFVVYQVTFPENHHQLLANE